jgi:hypothetical protein
MKDLAQSTRDLMAKVYKEKLNIYALLNRVQNETTYSLPEELIIMVCEDYLKYKGTIRNQWAWLNKVLRLKRDELYVSLRLKEEKKYKHEVNSTLLKNLFGGR